MRKAVRAAAITPSSARSGRAQHHACSTWAAAKANCWRWLDENKNVEARGVETRRHPRAAGHRQRRLGLPGRYRTAVDGLPRPGLRLRHPAPDPAGDARTRCGCCADAARRPPRHRGLPQLRPLVRAPGHLFSGRAPKTELFPYSWYDSPNIHFLTVQDFEELVEKEGWTVERKIFRLRPGEVWSSRTSWPKSPYLFSESGESDPQRLGPSQTPDATLQKPSTRPTAGSLPAGALAHLQPVPSAGLGQGGTCGSTTRPGEAPLCCLRAGKRSSCIPRTCRRSKLRRKRFRIDILYEDEAVAAK